MYSSFSCNTTFTKQLFALGLLLLIDLCVVNCLSLIYLKTQSVRVHKELDLFQGIDMYDTQTDYGRFVSTLNLQENDQVWK